MTHVSQTHTVHQFHLGAHSPQNVLFYTAPSSPMQLEDDEFEFTITSQRFASRCEFQQTYPAFGWTNRSYNEDQKYWLPARAKSFCSGQVLPLKLPPRLQTSVSSSPRSPNSLIKIHRPCAWNDDFDPFQFALEKVSEETRARMSFHRRSHSYSAYRTSGVSHWLDQKQGLKPDSAVFDQGACHGFHVGLPTKTNEHLKSRGPTLAKMMERKQSVRVPSEPTFKPRSGSSPMIQTKSRRVWLGRRVKDADHVATRNESNCTESKMHRLISLMFKFKKETNESTRGWKLRRCLGYAP
ncbi:hypothetical protein L2E82_44929 [Cichorium intybus]|uniref:Uncharacterized protein n=1 Tax=Cichorium intybus TaxID=13427 RepID=A0ACB8ZRP0_CICIN|nr:hypothetical protein L2E82_44929 [Cichorium intybus]